MSWVMLMRVWVCVIKECLIGIFDYVDDFDNDLNDFDGLDDHDGVFNGL